MVVTDRFHCTLSGKMETLFQLVQIIQQNSHVSQGTRNLLTLIGYIDLMRKLKKLSDGSIRTGSAVTPSKNSCERETIFIAWERMLSYFNVCLALHHLLQGLFKTQILAWIIGKQFIIIRPKNWQYVIVSITVIEYSWFSVKILSMEWADGESLVNVIDPWNLTKTCFTGQIILSARQQIRNKGMYLSVSSLISK